jgi:hypothetical protein
VSRFLKALQKAGLVELERSEPDSAIVNEADADQVLQELRRDARAQERAADGAVATPAPATPAEPLGDAGSVTRPFDTIYAEAGVAASPFPAEKMLKVLDGLKALDPSARKAAVMALDAADETWGIDDVLLDAQRKSRVLEDAKRRVQSHSEAAHAQARAQIERCEQQQQQTVATIRQQISELEALLEREITRSAQEKAAAEQSARSVHDACVAEAARLDAEVLRLSELARIFSPPADAPGA